jgi:hypothetical protein
MFFAESCRVQPVAFWAPVMTGVRAQRGCPVHRVAAGAGVGGGEGGRRRQPVGAVGEHDGDVARHGAVHGLHIGLAWVREHGWLAEQAVPVPFGAA